MSAIARAWSNCDVVEKRLLRKGSTGVDSTTVTCSFPARHNAPDRAAILLRNRIA